MKKRGYRKKDRQNPKLSQVTIFFPQELDPPDRDVSEENLFNLQPLLRRVHKDDRIRGAAERLLENPTQTEIDDARFIPLETSNLRIESITVTLRRIRITFEPEEKPKRWDDLLRAVFLDAVERTLSQFILVRNGKVIITIKNEQTFTVDNEE